MKKGLFVVVIMFFALIGLIMVNSTWVLAENQTISCEYGSPVLDGREDAFWKEIEFITGGTVVDGKSDTTIAFKTAWNEEMFYYYIEVYDTTPNTVGLNWMADSIDFQFDFVNDDKPGEADVSLDLPLRGYISLSRSGSIGGACGGLSSANIGMAAFVSELENDLGYAAEGAILWPADSEIYEGKVIGFDIQINDNISGTTRDAIITWSSPDFMGFARSNGYGDVTLVNSGIKGEEDMKAEDTIWTMEELLTPIWEGNTVYNESVMVLKNADGTVDPISLIYPIDSVVSVRSASLQTTYEENVDYKIEDGKLVIMPDGKIPMMEYSDYYPESKTNNCFEGTNGGYVYWSEGFIMHNMQIVVTYHHNSNWSGDVPEGQADALKNTIKKLENKEALNIVFYGDSITEGCNASGFVGAAPFVPKWSDLVTTALKDKYGYEDITCINTAVGGTGSGWALANVKDRVIEHNPDLVVLAFGGNDVVDRTGYITYVKKIVTKIRESNPDCEFVLIAPMIPNKEARGFMNYQPTYRISLNEYAKTETGIAVADVTAVHSQLLEVKSYRDMSGNNINHPNDFLVRIYAQVILETFDEESLVEDMVETEESDTNNTEAIDTQDEGSEKDNKIFIGVIIATIAILLVLSIVIGKYFRFFSK